VTVTRAAHQIDIRVPLAALNAPDRILAGARTYLGEIPFDLAPWRVVLVRS
jgi:hypothetical protein